MVNTCARTVLHGMHWGAWHTIGKGAHLACMQREQQADQPLQRASSWSRSHGTKHSDHSEAYSEEDQDGHVSTQSHTASRSSQRLRNAIVPFGAAHAPKDAWRGGAAASGFAGMAGRRSAAQRQKQQQALLAAGGGMGMLLRGLAGSGEAACAGASVTFTVAAAAAAHGRVPDSLLSLVSPFRAQMEEVKVLGKGGFGSVSLVRSKLDHRLMAVKTVRFNSTLPPWSSPEALEAAHHKLLREVGCVAFLLPCIVSVCLVLLL